MSNCDAALASCLKALGVVLLQRNGFGEK
jgi:hypothetical protein